MTDKALREVLDESTLFLKNQLHLQQWYVRTYLNKLGEGKDGKAGMCHRQYEYKSAGIAFDPFELRHKKEAHEVLRHEMLHLVMAPMVRIFSAMEPFLDKKQKELLGNVLSEVEHDIIHHLEGILTHSLKAPLRPTKRKRKKR